MDALEAVLYSARCGVQTATPEEGFARIRYLTDALLSDATLAEAVAAAVRDGLLRDPVRLLPGRLQCCWELELILQTNDGHGT